MLPKTKEKKAEIIAIVIVFIRNFAEQKVTNN